MDLFFVTLRLMSMYPDSTNVVSPCQSRWVIMKCQTPKLNVLEFSGNKMLLWGILPLHVWSFISLALEELSQLPALNPELISSKLQSISGIGSLCPLSPSQVLQHAHKTHEF